MLCVTKVLDHLFLDSCLFFCSSAFYILIRHPQHIKPGCATAGESIRSMSFCCCSIDGIFKGDDLETIFFDHKR
jgi:hypothetical protein